MIKALRTTISIMILFVIGACSSDSVENLYSNYTVYFRFTPVTSVAPLQVALNSPNEFCAIWLDKQVYRFQSLTQTGEAQLTALSNYQSIKSVGGGGFIVGLGSLPEMGSDVLPLFCYARVCSNCYSETGISKALTLQEGGIAYCARCKRHYDLNNGGLVTDSTGVKLFRHPINYLQNSLLIQR